jgi:cyclophilin family peptidyl-prolyl cis-trans isomerase
MRTSGVLALAAAVLLAAPASARAQPSPRVADERIVFRTDMGDLVFALYPDVAPITVAQLLKLARLGAFDTICCARVEPTFVEQFSVAADRLTPLTPEQTAAIHTVPDEFSTTLKHGYGTLEMAHGDAANSGETSISILLCAAPHLDGKYTIFGRLERGDDVVEAIKKVECDSSHRPKRRITVRRAVVVTPAELSRLELKGPPAETTAPEDKHVSAAGPLAFVVLVMMLLGAATFLTAGRLGPRTVGAFGLATVLVGAFYLFVALLPEGQREPGIAGGLFVGLLCLFKLMSRFESTIGAPPPASK